MLPDGGTAVWARRLSLPRSISFTREAIEPILAWDAESSYVSFEHAGHLFSLVVAMERDRLAALVEGRELVTFHWTRVGRPEVSATTGERFRPLHAHLVA